MTLLELHVDVARVADALERIAFLLERLVFPPSPADVKVHQATLDDLHTVTPEDIARMGAEQMEFAERFRVVPGSPAMMQALQDWEAEQRSLYGKDWQAPEDWRTILAAARGSVREFAGEAAAAPADPRSQG
jgi:hypothetical protein